MVSLMPRNHALELSGISFVIVVGVIHAEGLDMDGLLLHVSMIL